MKQYSKILFSEAIMGMKLKLCRNANNNNLYKKCVLLPLLMDFRCYGNLKFPLSYNRKSESRPLLLTHCRYVDKGFREMFLDTKRIIFAQSSEVVPNPEIKYISQQRASQTMNFETSLVKIGQEIK